MGRKIHHYPHMDPELGDISKLTPRQRDIADLIRKGCSNVEMAVELEISLETVNSHVDALKDKFHALSKYDLINQFWVHGILERPRMMAIAAFFLCALSAMPQGRITVRAPQGRPKVAQVMRVNRQEISGVIA